MKNPVFVFLSMFFLVQCTGKGPDVPPETDDPADPPQEFRYNKLPFPLHKEGEPFDTFRGLVMAGYQGWFGAPGDGCKHGDVYAHYQSGGVFQPGPLHNSIDFWPDVSEYEKTYPSDFRFSDGTQARVFSSYDRSSVMLHFKWMSEYGIDGVFVQRFLTEVLRNTQGKDHSDKVLENAMYASNYYSRAICITYDLSGGFNTGGRTCEMALADAAELMKKYDLKNRKGQKYYLYENGKPLICVWGAGFSGRNYSVADVRKFVDGLKDLGFSVMLGVPAYWRELFADAVTDVALHDLIKSCDAIFPWSVGRFNMSGAEGYKFTVREDLKWCKAAGVLYAANIFPGFSWENMNPGSASSIDRASGAFFWKQAYNVISEGAEAIYISMFDEIDEGTAIFKMMNSSAVPSNVPVSDYYIYCDNGKYSTGNVPKDVPGGWCRRASEMNIGFQGIEDGFGTDRYLWLTMMIRSMFRGSVPLDENIPESN